MSTERFGGSVLINGVAVAMSDEEVDRLLRARYFAARNSSDVSKTRDDLMTALVERFGFALEVPFRGLSGKRQFRWDAAIGSLRLAVEYQGWGSGAAHQFRGKQAGDHEKLSEAAILGWTVIVCDAVSAKSGKCLEYVEAALKGANDATRTD